MQNSTLVEKSLLMVVLMVAALVILSILVPYR
jgi:hypothetical protein